MKAGSFADVLDQAIRSRRVTLAWLSERVSYLGDPVSVTTLSYWRSGRRTPQGDVSLDVVGRLEEVLHLDSGALTALLPPRPRPGPDPKAQFGDLLGISETHAHLLASIGCPDPFVVSSVGGTMTVDVDSTRRTASIRNLVVWEARVDGVRNIPFYWRFDSPAEGFDFESVHGAMVGRTAFDEQTSAFAAELILEAPLNRGETALVELNYTNAERDPVTNMQGVLERKVSETAIWVRFAPSAQPSKAIAYAKSEKESWTRAVTIAGGALHVLVRSFGPGVYGVKWEWPD